jgi:hypothetical protein
MILHDCVKQFSTKKLDALLQETERAVLENRISTFYPDEGPLRRELYPKHMAFFAAGREYQERAMVAANRIGKTMGVGAYETALHLTGAYPHWWVGHRFTGPIEVWAAGDTSERDRRSQSACREPRP